MKRRKFVKQVVTTAAGISLAPKLFAAANKKALGVQLYTVRDALSKDLTGSLDKIAALGYNELELFGYNGTFFGKAAKEFCKMCDDRGMKIISSHYMTGRIGNAAGTITNGWQKAVDDAAEAKIEYMICAWLPPAERTAEMFKALPELLNNAGETCAKSHIQFCYHNHDFEFQKINDQLPYDMILNSVNADHVKMEVDLYWITKAGYNPVDYFTKYPGRFPLWHVKDMDASGAFAEVGNGTIDFDKIFAARNMAGLKHWFVEQDVCKRDPFESLQISRDYVVKKGY